VQVVAGDIRGMIGSGSSCGHIQIVLFGDVVM